MRKRRPVDSRAGESQAVDYLLREFKGLGTKTPTTGIGATSTSSGGGPIEPSYLVAASDARDEIKAVADFVCDGVGDQEEINAAITAGHRVVLSAGQFYLTDRIYIVTGVTLEGVGPLRTQIENWTQPPRSDGGSSYKMIYFNASDYFTLRGMSISTYVAQGGGGTDDWTGCVEAGGATVVIENCVFQFDGTETSDEFINITPTVRADIRYNQFFDSADTAIRGSVDNVLVEGNYISGIGTNAGAAHIDLTGVRCQVLGNHLIGGTGAIGIKVTGQHSIVNDNIVTSAPGIAIDVNGDDSIVIGNVAPDGITIESTADATRIGGNIGTITDNGTNTVFLDNDDVADLSPLTTKGDLWGYSTVDARLPVGTDEYALFTDSAQALGVKWAAIEYVETWRIPGVLATDLDGFRWYAPFAATILAFEISVGTAPTDASLIVDVNKATTTLFTTQGNRPTITATNFVSGDAVPDVTAVADGDYIQLEVDQVGSTVAGSDLLCTMRYRRTP